MKIGRYVDARGREKWLVLLSLALCSHLRVCDKRAALFALIALLQRAASEESKTSVPFMNSAFETFETEKEISSRCAFEV